ncbi:MAG TPA: hypothetical protein VMW42_03620 [Desulfatiglandales bacterium]|nr:hypothetical protein [Desulfobacterales bacterium]HUU40010.1 hypothetical protein [Desulfatiglandales bacterium]
MTQFNGRPVTNIKLAGIDKKDHPDYCDAYVVSAVWGDTEDQLSEDELLLLSFDSGAMSELIQEHLQGEAEFLGDLREGR